MKIATMKQGSPEWHELKRGKIGGTKFGQVISGRDNSLMFDLLNERLSPWLDYNDEIITDDMRFGLDNEPIARELYIKQSGIDFKEVGCIISDYSGIHLASPDGLNEEAGIVLEIKSTQNGAKHLKRFFNGIDKEYWPQIKNYFAVSSDVKEVHWVSFCPDRFERPLIVVIVTLDTVIDERTGTETVEGKKVKTVYPVTIREMLHEWRSEITRIEMDLDKMEQSFLF